MPFLGALKESGCPHSGQAGGLCPVGAGIHKATSARMGEVWSAESWS